MESSYILHLPVHLWLMVNLTFCLPESAIAIVSERCCTQDMYEEIEPLQRGVDDSEMLAQLELDPAAQRELVGQIAGDSSPANLPLSTLNLYRDSSTDSVSDASASPMSAFEIVSSLRPSTLRIYRSMLPRLEHCVPGCFVACLMSCRMMQKHHTCSLR